MPLRLARSSRAFCRGALAALALLAGAPPAQPQNAPLPRTVWEIELGRHARELPTETFTDYACGTDGGPPSLALTGWSDFARCPAEAETGYREVYFRYDDEAEYVARARGLEDQVVFYGGTKTNDVPVIVSLLFDADGFAVGFRVVSDPRVDVATRELGADLAGPLMSRFGEDQFVCRDLDPLPGETPYQGQFIKRVCLADDSRQGLDIRVEAHRYRKPGQREVEHGEVTEGLFDSTTYFQAVLSAPIADRAARLAGLSDPPASERDALIARAKNCAGCNLRGVNLKRADLSGANLAGADLQGANLHGAVLRGADLTGAILVGANLNRADARQAKASGAVLALSMMYGSHFDGADLSAAIMNGIMAGRVTMARARLGGSYLINADLREARLNDADFSGAVLTGARLADVQMTRTDLSGAQLDGAVLVRIGLVEANLSGANLAGADLFDANLRGADLSRADLSGARMTSAVLTETKTDGARFEGTRLPAGFEPPG